jgi:alpha-beta hydrolase superfamily lysophospholipase
MPCSACASRTATGARRGQPGRRLVLGLALLLGLAGCTPAIMPAGLPLAPPGIADDGFVMSDGARLPYVAWMPEGPPRAILLGLHGFGDYSRNAFDLPAPLFTARGVGLYAYDQRGFGAAPNRGIWPGSATLASDAIAVVHLLRARHPGVPLYLMGESMGAAVALAAAKAAEASGEPLPVEGYILLSPGVRGRATMSGLERWALEIASRIVPIMGFRGSAPGFSPTDNPEAMERWGRDPLTLKEFRVDLVYGLVNLMDDARAAASGFRAPALILYGGRDRIVRSNPVRQLVEALPADAPHRFGFYPNGHHLLLRDRARARAASDILAWMESPTAPLPSGADEAAVRWRAVPR